jgi:hypothetical protein
LEKKRRLESNAAAGNATGPAVSPYGYYYPYSGGGWGVGLPPYSYMPGMAAPSPYGYMPGMVAPSPYGYMPGMVAPSPYGYMPGMATPSPYGYMPGMATPSPYGYMPGMAAPYPQLPYVPPPAMMPYWGGVW